MSLPGGEGWAEGKGGEACYWLGSSGAPFAACSHSIFTEIEKQEHWGLKRSPGVSFLFQEDHYELLLMSSNIQAKFIIFHLLKWFPSFQLYQPDFTFKSFVFLACFASGLQTRAGLFLVTKKLPVSSHTWSEGCEPQQAEWLRHWHGLAHGWIKEAAQVSRD